MFDLSGKTALVTGASGGIGRAIAEALHGQGASVVLSGTRREALDTLAQALGERVHVVPCDLSDIASVEALVPAAEAAAAPIDILVNNAGVTRDNLFMRMRDEEWDQVIAVNLTAGFRLARACTKGMMRRRWGRIIAVTSVVGTMGNAGQANYAASKGAMVAMTKSLAAEVGDAQRHRELHRAGLHRDADDRRAQREAAHRDPHQRADATPRAACRRRGVPRCSWPVPKPPT